MIHKHIKSLPHHPKRVIIISLIIALAVGTFGYIKINKKITTPIVEENTTTSLTTSSSRNLTLAFLAGGGIKSVLVKAGDNVKKGQILATLDAGNVQGVLTQAKAAYETAKAGLIIAQQHASASKDNVVNVTAQQNTLVQNAYRNLLNSTPEAIPYNGTSDYVAPTISGNYNLGKEGTIKVSFTYDISGGVDYKVFGLASGSGSCNAITAQPLGDSGLYIKCSTTTINISDWNIEIPNKQAPDYLTNYNAYQLSLETRDKTIADAEASVGTADSSSVTDAQVAQAQASVDSALARIQNAEIIAPISGVITQFDAKVGQLASGNTPLISIISSGGYEVDAGVSETDIGKISIGNKVTMTLDAFPNETFMGTVFYIAPAETNVQGVVSYQTKISFDKLDPRLKSGLTANIDIETKHKDNILILPQYAILQNDEGTFVQTLENKNTKQNPVILGIVDQKGNVEMISGVMEGEQVLNIGLKTQ